MTETVNENAEAVEAPEAPVFPNNDAEVSFNMINGLIKDRNAKVGKINAVKGDRLTLLKTLENESDNPAAVEARARRDQAQAALDQAIVDLHAAVQPEINAVIADAEGEAKKIEEEIKDLDSKIKPATSFFKKMFGENLAKHLVALERLKGFSTKGAGTSGRRIRGYDAAVTIDGTTTGYDNLASVAKYLGVETSQLQEAFFSAAGNPENLKDAPDEVKFSVTYTEVFEDGSTEDKTAVVTCTRTAKADEAPEADEAEVTEAPTAEVPDDVSSLV